MSDPDRLLAAGDPPGGPGGGLVGTATLDATAVASSPRAPGSRLSIPASRMGGDVGSTTVRRSA